MKNKISLEKNGPMWGMRLSTKLKRKATLSACFFNIYIAGALGFPCGSDGKESTYNVGDQSSVPGLGRSPGEGNGYLLQFLACRISWTEEPGRLQSMASQRVGND